MDEYYKFYKLINRNIMVIKKVFPLLGSLLFMFSSCMDDIDVIQKSTVLETKSSSFDDILTFNSREDFGETMHLLLNEDAQTLATNAPIETLPIGQSLYDQPSYKQYMNVYVPNPQFAKLLNKKGEIVVSDTVYRITPNGTYFFPLNKKQDFENIYSQDSLICGNLISDSDRIYKISDDIYRIDTYHYMRTPEYQRFVNDDDIETYAASNNVSYGSDPDYSKFKTFDMRTENIWQFLVRNIFRGGQHGHTEQFSYEKRRVKGDFYEQALEDSLELSKRLKEFKAGNQDALRNVKVKKIHVKRFYDGAKRNLTNCVLVGRMFYLQQKFLIIWQKVLIN